jgi:hypothetical protein
MSETMSVQELGKPDKTSGVDAAKFRAMNVADLLAETKGVLKREPKVAVRLQVV